jgi:hypothetical protein
MDLAPEDWKECSYELVYGVAGRYQWVGGSRKKGLYRRGEKWGVGSYE